MNRGILAAALALIILGIDFLIFPDLIEDRVLVRALAAIDVVGGEPITLGKFRQHTIRVSYGRLIDAKYVSSLGPNTDALAVSAAPNTAGKPSIGALADHGEYVLSERESLRLLEVVQGTPSLPIGSIQVFKPKKNERGSLASIKTILILRTKYGDDRDAKEALKNGLVGLLSESNAQSVSGLVLPALTVGSGERGTPTFNEFFDFLFYALAEVPSPPLVDITLYPGWATSDLEAAIAALNAQWKSHASDRAGVLPKLHRYQLRLMLIGLAICFVVSSRYVVVGFKTALILATGFALSLLGSFKTVETVTDGLGNDATAIILAVFTLILGLGFPYITNWSVKDLFKEVGNGR